MACLMPEHDMFVLMIVMLGIGILRSVNFCFHGFFCTYHLWMMLF
jgi:hypothetical protein